MKRNRNKRTGTRKIHRTRIVILALAAAVIVGIGLVAIGGARNAVELQHIHGMGFSPDGKQLFVAAHDGFRVFADGAWQVPNLPKHDYMGYSPADTGFYSSGHPHPSAGMVNPLGLVKSTDGGTTLTTLAFEGESDFHVMGVGYENHAIYVINTQPNSKLSTGMYYSLDDGQTWEQSAMQGLPGPPIQVAVHPTEANVVAMATQSGLALSTDYGDTFALVGERGPVTAVHFGPTGDRLFFGYQELSAYDLASEAITTLSTPALTENDAIGYIAVNPTDADTIVFATFNRNIYVSHDSGQAWQQIASEGTGTN